MSLRDLIIEKIEDSETGNEVLNEVGFILFKPEHKGRALDLLRQKKMSENLGDELLSRLQKVCQKHGHEQVKKLIEDCKQGKVMSSDSLTKIGPINLGNGLSTVECEFLKETIGWAGKSGGKTEDGAGERALILLSGGSEKPPNDGRGDIKCGDSALEVKGMSSRLSHSGSPKVIEVKKKLAQWLEENGEKGVEDKDFANKGKYSYNPNKSGLKKIEEDCIKYGWDLGGFLSTIIGASFRGLTEKQISDGKREFMNSDGTMIDFEKFIVVWARFEFMEYIDTTRCCGIGFVNVENLNYHFFPDEVSFSRFGHRLQQSRLKDIRA